MKRLLVVVVLVLLSAHAASAASPGEAPAAALPELVPPERLPATDVLPYMEAAIAPGRNCAYSGAFQLAWNYVIDNVDKERSVGGPVKLSGGSPMADALNQQAFELGDMEPEWYLVWGGPPSHQRLPAFRRAARKFRETPIPLPDPGTDRRPFAVGYVQRLAQLVRPLPTLAEPLLFQGPAGATEVRAFGLREPPKDRMTLSQVLVLDYEDDTSFAIQLDTSSRKDQLVLAKVQPQPTLAATVAAVRQRVREVSERRLELADPFGADASARFHEGDTLVIPVLALNVDCTYTELLGKDLENPGWEGVRLGDARHLVRFRLDGAAGEDALGSEELLPLPSEPGPPRRFVFDRPFLVYLQDWHSQTPYFAMWVANPEVMEPVGADRELPVRADQD